jgi:type VI secretion system protein ImpF
MAEQLPLDRLLPCLLWRLTDDEPAKAQESRNERVVSMRKYRDSVLQDLVWLFNSRREPFHEPWEDYPEVKTSVLSYGMPDLCGLTISNLNNADLERQIVETIERFEPRIRRCSVKVLVDPDSSQNLVSFELRGELWAKPMPDLLFLKSDVDLESGRFDVKDNG